MTTIESIEPIESLAQQWLDLDKDPVTRNEISALLADGNSQELELRLRTRIAFGTAGLRARMEAGFARMNSLTVIQATQGLAEYVLGQAPDAQSRGVVIGRDARHNSEKFARLAAAAFVAKGIRVWWLEKIVHTPLVPFSVGMLGAVAGVMVTASHNPAQDNGYKVYWSNGCQIIPPHDVGIAESIERNLVPLSWQVGVVDEDQGMVEFVLDRARDAYFQTVKQTIKDKIPWPNFVYTPMHGVGLAYLRDLINCLGAGTRYISPGQESSGTTKRSSGVWCTVPQQAEPDPNFPTVKFPNPEEKGALELAQKLAQSSMEAQIPLVIATDPDADRLAVSEYVDGRWHQFTGNQLGVLFAHSMLSSQPRKDRSRLTMLCSTVSTSMLRVMAEKEGFEFEETLTGFKWLGNVAQDLMLRYNRSVPFAFEEAIGYMFSDIVFDKDGISAAVSFLQAAAKWWIEESLTPFAKLQQLYKRYGYFADANTYLISPSSKVTFDVFNSIRASKSSRDEANDINKPYPSHVGSHKIFQWRDLTNSSQYDSSTESKMPTLPVSADQMITCVVDGGVRFTARASGTEPKIKLYVEGRADGAGKAETAATAVQQALINEWFTPDRWGLKLAA